MGTGAGKVDLAEDLISQIDALSPGDRRHLRAAAGRGKPTNPASEAIVARMLPPGLAPAEAEHYFYAITLCAACRAGKEGEGSFGHALGTADREEQTGQFSAILARLLDIEDLAFQTSQVARGIKYLNAAKISLDRALLLRDILSWNDPGRRVRQTWAKEYARANARRTPDRYNDTVRDFLAVLERYTELQWEAFEACVSIPLPEAPGAVLIAFYTALPETVYPLDEDLFYQAAIFNALNFEPCVQGRNLGAALRLVCTPENESHLALSLKQLVESDRSQLYPLLLQAIIYLRKLKVGFCPEQLLNDLLFWDHPAHSVQSAWWDSFFNP